MLKLTIILALAVGLVFSCILPSLATATRSIESGLVDCGSNGTLIGLAVGSCTAAPCSFVSGGTEEVALAFVAYGNSEVINFKVLATVDNGVEYLAYDFDITQNIVSGTPYFLHYSLPTTDVYLGRLILRLLLTDKESGTVEICTTAQADIVEAKHV